MGRLTCHFFVQVHLAQMGLKVFQAQQKLEQMDKDQKQRSEAQARMNQQPSSPQGIPAAGGAFSQQPGALPFTALPRMTSPSYSTAIGLCSCSVAGGTSADRRLRCHQPRCRSMHCLLLP